MSGNKNKSGEHKNSTKGRENHIIEDSAAVVVPSTIASLLGQFDRKRLSQQCHEDKGSLSSGSVGEGCFSAVATGSKKKKRKRAHQEKKRRNDLNTCYGELMALLMRVDPGVGGDPESIRKGDDNFPTIVSVENLLPRTDLIKRSIATITATHDQNQQLKHVLQSYLKKEENIEKKSQQISGESTTIPATESFENSLASEHEQSMLKEDQLILLQTLAQQRRSQQIAQYFVQDQSLQHMQGLNNIHAVRVPTISNYQAHSQLNQQQALQTQAAILQQFVAAQFKSPNMPIQIVQHTNEQSQAEITARLISSLLAQKQQQIAGQQRNTSED